VSIQGYFLSTCWCHEAAAWQDAHLRFVFLWYGPIIIRSADADLLDANMIVADILEAVQKDVQTYVICGAKISPALLACPPAWSS
jgi:hypothetical protein